MNKINLKPEQPKPWPASLATCSPILVRGMGDCAGADLEVVIVVADKYLFIEREKLTYASDLHWIKENYHFIRYLSLGESVEVFGRP